MDGTVWPTTPASGWIRLFAGTLLYSLVLVGCGSSEVDRDDELGTEAESSADDYELVIIDESAEEDAGHPPDPDVAGDDVHQSPSPAVAAASDTGGVVVYDPEGEFTVQVALLENARDAGTMVQELTRRGFPAYAVARPDGGGVRVRIGYFSTRSDAQRFGGRFQEDTGSDYWVDRRTNEMF
ncbi:SPOR domain-containing protein [Candidatus Latescibacterota bacterium]